MAEPTGINESILEKLNIANIIFVGEIIPLESEGDENTTGFNFSDENLTEEQKTKMQEFGMAGEKDRANAKQSSGTSKPKFVEVAREFKTTTVDKLLIQTRDQIANYLERKGFEINSENSNLIRAQVTQKLYSNVQIDSESNNLRIAEFFPEDTGNIVEDAIHRILNAKANELKVDPRVPLIEHKLEPALITAANNFEDTGISKSLVTKILGFDKAFAEGLISYQIETDDFETIEEEIEKEALSELLSESPVLLRMVENITSKLEFDYLDYMEGRDDKGDFVKQISQNIVNNPEDYLVSIEKINPVDVNLKKLLTDESKLNSFVFDLIDDYGGIGKPDTFEQNGATLSKIAKKGYGDINREIRDEIGELVERYIDSEGNVLPAFKAQAHIKNVTPEDFVTSELRKAVEKYFIPDNNDQTLYSSKSDTHIEAIRRAQSPSDLSKDLTEALASDRDLWVNGQPVDKSRVSDATWQNWTNTFKNESPEAALATIGEGIGSAVTQTSEGESALAIFNIAVEKGIINSKSTPEFIAHFRNNVAPRIAAETEFSGAVGVDAINELYDSKLEDLPAYDRFSEDFMRISTQTPDRVPGFPGLNVGTAVEKPFIPPQFDTSEISIELAELSADRPEFRQFLEAQLGSSEFTKAWEQASKPKFDEVAFRERTTGVLDEDSAMLERQQARLETAEQQYTDLVNRGEETSEAVAALERAQESYRRETGRDAITGQTDTVSQAFQTGGFAKRLAREQLTTPGMTSADFFRSQLPGFEQRYEDSAFFRLEEDRLERERRETLRTPSGPSRTIVRAGRR